WRGGDRVAGGAALVQRRRRDDGNLVGRGQWASDCGAPTSGPQGDRDHLFDRRSIRRRRALHWRAVSHRRAWVALVLFRPDVPSARSAACRRSLAGDVAGAAGERSAVRRYLAAAPAT